MSAPSPTDPPSPTPRRISTPSWFDLRLVVGVVLVLGSVLLGARIVAGAGRTYDAVAVDRDLAAGKVLSASDLHIAQVQLPDHGRSVYVPTIKQVVGRTLRHDVARNELLPLGALSAGLPATTFTVPLASGAAPDLHAGDRIELFLSTSVCSSVVLLPSVTVQSVRRESGGSFGAGGAGQDVVVVVPSDVITRIVSALAIDQAQIRAGVLTHLPAASGTPTPTPTPTAPSGVAPSGVAPSDAPPSDISTCAPSK